MQGRVNVGGNPANCHLQTQKKQSERKQHGIYIRSNAVDISIGRTEKNRLEREIEPWVFKALLIGKGKL